MRLRTSAHVLCKMSYWLAQFCLPLLLANAILLCSNAYAAGRSGDSSRSTLAGAAAEVNLVAVLQPTLGLSISTLNLDVPIVDPNQGSATITVPITSSWTLNNSTSAVELVAYFESPESALADNQGDLIPSGRVLGGLNAQTMAPFAETARVGTPGAARVLYHQALASNRLAGTREDQLHIRVAGIGDLRLPPGQYRGTLHLRLVAY